MAPDFQSIPLIDISTLLQKIDDPKLIDDEDLIEVVRKLDEACKTAGFFYVKRKNSTEMSSLNRKLENHLLLSIKKGHGIPDSLVKQVREVTREFFKLPYEEKLKIKMASSSGYRGYQCVGENITKGKPDMHEAIDCYREIGPGTYGDLGKPLEGSNLWPDYPSNFKVMVEEYICLLKDLSRKIMRGIALALGGRVDAFEGNIAGDSFWVMRLIGYPVSSDIPEAECTDTGCGAHTDYGLLTLVNQDEDICALQVRNHSGEWIDATPIPGAFVCNIGDMLKIWSNGLYESTLHRVINNSPKYRVSVAFFYEPNFDAHVEPFDSLRQRKDDGERCENVVYGEHLVRKVLTNFRYV